MPNRFVTLEEFSRDLIETTGRNVEKMPLSACEQLATCGVHGVGINAGIAVALIHASQLRVARQPGFPEPAD